MIFAVVEQTYKDAPSNPLGLPDDYPLSMIEVSAESIDEVKAVHPGKLVMTAEQANSYTDGCQMLFDQKLSAWKVSQDLLKRQQAYDQKPWYARIFSSRPTV